MHSPSAGLQDSEIQHNNTGFHRKTSRFSSIARLKSPLSSLGTRAFSRRTATRTRIPSSGSTVALLTDWERPDDSTPPVSLRSSQTNACVRLNSNDKPARPPAEALKITRSYTTNDLIGVAITTEDPSNADLPSSVCTRSPKNSGFGNNTSGSFPNSGSTVSRPFCAYPTSRSPTKLPVPCRSTTTSLKISRFGEQTECIGSAGSSANYLGGVPPLPRSKTQPNLGALRAGSTPANFTIPRKAIQKESGNPSLQITRRRTEVTKLGQEWPKRASNGTFVPSLECQQNFGSIHETPSRMESLQHVAGKAGQQFATSISGSSEISTVRPPRVATYTHRRQSSYASPTQSSAAKIQAPITPKRWRPQGELSKSQGKVPPPQLSSFDVAQRHLLHPISPTSHKRSSNSFSGLEVLASRFKSATEDTRTQQRRKSEVPRRFASPDEEQSTLTLAEKAKAVEESLLSEEQTQKVFIFLTAPLQSIYH
jgi:hypothetical protein